MARFEGVDYYEFDSLLSEEERLVRDSVREFVSEQVLPIIEHHNRAGTFPTELIPAIAELGMAVSVLPTVMRSDEERAGLARALIELATASR